MAGKKIIMRTGEALAEAEEAWSAAEPEVVIGELDGPTQQRRAGAARELGTAFDLVRCLRFGILPATLAFDPGVARKQKQPKGQA